MELYDNIRKISFWFFVGLGIVHFWAGLMFVSNYGVPLSGLINRVTFIPFFVAAYTYFFSQLKHFLIENGIDKRWLTNLLLALGVALFVIAVGVEFFAVDDPTPLIRP